MKVVQNCPHCRREYTWESNKLVRDKTSEFDLDILCHAKTNGISTQQLCDFASGAGIRVKSTRSYYNMEQLYLYPAILEVYQHQENNVRQYIKSLDKGITIAGDGRYDSPGFSAKYCAYLLMETSTGLIIYYQKRMEKDLRH